MPDLSRNQPRILIVDDEPAIRRLLLELLCDDFQCSEAASAEEALALLRESSFNLVLSDIMMEGLSGLEMIPHVLEQAPDTVIIVISGERNIESAIQAMRSGAFDYVTKPFDFGHVEAAVRRALDYQALRQTKRRYEHDLEELVTSRTAELDHLAYHDSLTNLPNRILFEDRLNQALSLARRNQQILAVIFLGLDRFKTINDTLGYIVGDRLLQDVAKRLSTQMRDSDTVARFGGNEFALLVLTQIRRTEDAVAIAEKIRDTIRPPFAVGEHELYLTASIGISVHPHDGENSQVLLRNAGAALERAKQMGGDDYQFYTAEMNARALKRLLLESSLKQALEREEFVVYYQPQVTVGAKKIVGLEALVRWRHPENGLVSPAEFIPVAEETGLIVPISEWVLRTACAQNKLWQEEGFEPLRLAVNISARHFQKQGLSETVVGILEETGLDSRYLELEITETSIMTNPGYTVTVLENLKEKGVRVSIDDFGTGYSSLGHLKRLPLDMLKIDQSFVRDATGSADDAAIVTAIITLAHSLRLRVLAEGVETEDQLDFLRQLKCDEMQGYLFSRPLPAEALRELLLKEGPTGNSGLLN